MGDFHEHLPLFQIFIVIYLAAKITPNTKAQAVMGLDGLRRTLVELFIKDIYIADSFEDAVEWLVKQ